MWPLATAHPRHHMTLRMERRDTRISGPRTHSACDGPGAVPLLLYARPSLGPQPRALWSAARISAAAPRAPAGSHSVTNMQRSKSFVSGSDGSHRSCRYVIVCCRMPTGAGPGPRHCQPESRRLPPLSRPSQSMPVTSGASGPPEPNSRSKPSPSKVPASRTHRVVLASREGNGLLCILRIWLSYHQT